jgi:hypothetical protein
VSKPSAKKLAAAAAATSSLMKKQATVKQTNKKRRRISAETVDSEDDADGEVDESYLANLSFSSTSTASTVDSLVTVADSTVAGGYFALGSAVAAAAAQQDVGAKQADDERECAELLLGLGGFF